MHSRRFLPPSLVTALLAALALVIIATGLPLRASSAPIRLTSLNDTANMPSNVENLTNVGGVAYFHVRTGMGSQLWRSDGTSQGTRPVDVGLGAVEIRIPYRVGGKLLLFAPDSSSTNTLGLYVAQSEPGTASLLKGELAVVEGPTGAAFGVVNGTLIFAVRNAGGADLWRSDGTAAGTQFVTRISTDTEAFLRNVAVIDNLVYFFSSADTAPTTYRLWRSDGTAAGTFVLSNAFQQDEFSTSFQLVGLNGIVYFGAKGTGRGGAVAERWQHTRNETRRDDYRPACRWCTPACARRHQAVLLRQWSGWCQTVGKQRDRGGYTAGVPLAAAEHLVCGLGSRSGGRCRLVQGAGRQRCGAVAKRRDHNRHIPYVRRTWGCCCFGRATPVCAGWRRGVTECLPTEWE
jgi:ELWxxDGT repeat protein